MTKPELNPHAAALLAALATTTYGTPPAPLKIGDGVAPRAADDKVVSPCAVLHITSGGHLAGSLGCPDVDADLRFQVTCVGRVAAEARRVADVVHAALTAAPLTVAGRYVCRVRRLDLGAGVERDDDVRPPLFYVPQKYALTSNET